MGCGSASKIVNHESVEDDTFIIPEQYIANGNRYREGGGQFDPNKRLIPSEKQIESLSMSKLRSSFTIQSEKAVQEDLKTPKAVADKFTLTDNLPEEPFLSEEPFANLALNKSTSNAKRENTDNSINGERKDSIIVSEIRKEYNEEDKSSKISLYMTDTTPLQYPKVHQNLIKEIFAYQNMCRENPGYITATLKELLQKGLSSYPDEVLKETIQYTSSRKPTNPLVWDTKLFMACVDHVMDLGQKGIVSNKGSDGSTVYERANRYGKFKGMCGENIQIGSRDPKEIVLSIITDKKSASKVHRKTLMEERYKKGALCLGRHSRFGVWTVFAYSE